MRYAYFGAGGYIGFEAKLGLKEIYIDFSKCLHNIIVIKGGNGYGKSTLMNILHILPDGSEYFLKDTPAYKKMGIIDEGIMYKIFIKSDIKTNGDRETTKAYITRVMLCDGIEEELNPNGNISSYKDIVYTLFNLDANFIALSKLTSEDRGIVDKTPAERKKFVNSIICNIEFYNNMHKILSKKSSIFKSMVNTIVGKIDSIGNPESLNMTLVSLENRINTLTIQKDKYIADIAINNSKIQLLDPNGLIQSEYDDIYKSLTDVTDNLKMLSGNMDKLLGDVGISKEDVYVQYDKLIENINYVETNIKILESKANTVLQSREDEAKALQSKSSKLATLQMESNYTDLKQMIDDTKNLLLKYDELIKLIGIDVFNISKDEFILGLNTLKDIKDTFIVLKTTISNDIIVKSVSYMRQGSYPNLMEIDITIESIKSSINEDRLELQKYYSLAEVAEKLSLRPGNCNIDSCNFIKDALDANSKNPNQMIEIISNRISNNENILDIEVGRRLEYIDINNAISYINTIVRSVETNASIINKLPIDLNIFSNRVCILDAIENGYSFDEIDILYQYIQYSNIIDEYKAEYDKLKVLENDFKIYEAKNTILDDILSDIDELNIRITEIEKELNLLNLNIAESKSMLSTMKNNLFKYESLIELCNTENGLLVTKKDIINKYNTIKDNIVNIKQYTNNLVVLQQNLDSISSQIAPLLNDRDTIKHSLTLSKEYAEELEIYNAKYSKVEVLKKYSSPTKKGIQLLFIDIYMNKLLSMSNNLLDVLYQGEYVLQKPVITDSEFSLPCMGSRLLANDISYMSNSQKAMISMVISFVMLLQSSTKFNIVRLDEVDYGLDTSMRLRFVLFVIEIMRILGIEQNIMITHNEELDLSNCDIILLGEYQDMPDFSDYNVIYNGGPVL